MLDCIGESPVSSLDGTGLADVASAKRILRETSREVQNRGWDFNSEKNYPLPLSVDGFIYTPTNTLRIDTTKEFQDVDVVHRGSRLYDRGNRTYVFTKTIKVDLLLGLPFEELPEAARHYITIRSARKFVDRDMPSEAGHVYTQKDEDLALVTLKEAEGDTGDYNMFNGSNSVARILER
ncbi:hypothetical protein A7981_05680 [Methylovorus sp. MM2]|nr:hypothetical protein A7981_05680 [Methylovorus sp. MM2]